MSATQVQEEAARRVRAAGLRDEEKGAAWKAAYLDMWADMKAWAAQEGPVHVAVARMLARSATAREEAAQVAETAGTETSPQTGRDVPAAKEEKLIVGGALASTAATTADEGEESGPEGCLSNPSRRHGSSPSRPTDGHEAAAAVLSGTTAEVVARCGVR